MAEYTQQEVAKSDEYVFLMVLIVNSPVIKRMLKKLRLELF